LSGPTGVGTRAGSAPGTGGEGRARGGADSRAGADGGRSSGSDGGSGGGREGGNGSGFGPGSNGGSGGGHTGGQGRGDEESRGAGSPPSRPDPPRKSDPPLQDDRQTPEILRDASPEYPDSAREDGVSGSVTLSYTVNGEGRVEDVRVTRSSGDPRLDRAATTAAKRWRYRPAVQNGRPYPVKWKRTLRFDLE
jgi:protein TonB